MAAYLKRKLSEVVDDEYLSNYSSLLIGSINKRWMFGPTASYENVKNFSVDWALGCLLLSIEDSEKELEILKAAANKLRPPKRKPRKAKKTK